MKRYSTIIVCFIVILMITGCNSDDSFTQRSYNNIKFEIPKSWEDTSSDNVAMYANKKDGADITLSVASTPAADITLEDYTKITTRSYSAGYISSSKSEDKKNLSNASVDEPEYLMVNNNKLSKTTITYDYKSEKDTFSFTEIVVCGIINNTIYQFNYKVHTDEYDTYKDIIDNSINTIAK